ncbi:MAG: hypothetical protein KDK05_23920, partial [Candidatus Competibacteraceae bacterium]|nr:hypothetical protein [Candidatus Competibacteraceae bacterium]
RNSSMISHTSKVLNTALNDIGRYDCSGQQCQSLNHQMILRSGIRRRVATTILEQGSHEYMQT